MALLRFVDGNGDPANGAPGNLREYVEYETTLNSFVLNNPTVLDTNASGPSAANRIRFESNSTQFAPGIDPTALENIVAGLYNNVSEFEFRIGAIQAGAGNNGANTRLTSLGFTCPSFNNSTATPASNPSLDLTDVHNGNGPAPVPGTEVLQNDIAPLGNSTDSATNGIWDTLAPGDTVRFVSTYIVSQQDIDTLQ